MEQKVYEVIIDNDKIEGTIEAISLVYNPAYESPVFFFENEKKQYFKFQKNRQEITGLAMEPFKKIKRILYGETFYVWFSEESIRRCAQVFSKNKNLSNLNFEHTGKKMAGYVFESWVVEDENTDKAVALGFKNVTKGQWYVTAMIEDTDLYNKIKENYDNGKAGWSIEGAFANLYANSFSDIDDKKIVDAIEKVLNSDLTDFTKIMLLSELVD